MLQRKLSTHRNLSTARLALALILFLCASTIYAATLDIRNIRVAKNGSVTRIVFDTNYIPKYKIFTLNNPSRVVIDFANGNLTTKVDQSIFKASFIQKLRHARRKNEKLRVVLDLNQQIVPKSFVLPPHENTDHRLVIDLKGASVKSSVAKSSTKPKNKKVANKPAKNKVAVVTPQKKVATSSKKSAAKKDIIAKVTTPKVKKKVATTPKKSTIKKASIAKASTPKTNKKTSAKPKLAKPIKPREIVIAVDPGHGGKDPGATGYAGTREKDVVLQISKRLVRLLNSEPGMRAILTRNSDRFLTLRGRIKKAREKKADIFLSIHADAIDDRRVRGSSVYVLSKNGASSEAAKILAQRENRSDVIGGVSLEGKDKVLQKVIVDLSQTATIDASMDLANNVIKELSVLGKTRKRIEHAGFAVLKSPDIPSILIETAFISNATEEKRLRSADHQQKLATSIFRGVKKYLDNHAPEDSMLAYQAAKEKHTIRSGETLSGIAQRYRVSLDALRSINALRTDRIRVGQKLIIPEV